MKGFEIMSENKQIIEPKELSKYRDYSVLNTDSYDKRRFNSLVETSKKLKEINELGTNSLYTFNPLLNDIWASLFKMKPEMKEDINKELSFNANMMKRILSDENFEKTRMNTRLDELGAAIGTVNYGEKTYEWIIEEIEKNEEMKKKLEEIQNMQQQQNDKGKNGNDGQPQQKGQGISSALQDAMNELNDMLNNALNGQDGTGNEQFQEKMQQAQNDTQEQQDQVEKLLGGYTPNGKVEMKKMPLREKLKIAELLAKYPKMKQLAEWAGRFSHIAMRKQRSKKAKSIDRNGITFGNSIEDLLPSELAMYNHPITKLDFLRRFSENQVMIFDKDGKAEQGKGQIICCIDESGSMKGLEMQAKGFALALMLIAKRQKRDFVLIPFSSNIGKVYEFPKGKVNTVQLEEIATNFMSGGTNFEKPLSKAMELITKNKYNRADIIFITDGDARISSEFKSKFEEVKSKKDFKLLSLFVNANKNRYKQLKEMSDKDVSIKDFTEENATIAFEI